jgi:hypothetical protein
LKKPSLKRAGGVPQGVGPEFKPSTTNNNQKVLFFFVEKNLNWQHHIFWKKKYFSIKNFLQRVTMEF